MRRISQPNPSERCQECGHPFSEHRGKRGCAHTESLKPQAWNEPAFELCPCVRFTFEPECPCPRFSAQASATEEPGQ
jgi:hypothetical protein